MRDLPQRLARGERIPARVVLVTAHPDDECMALGSPLALFDDLVIVHLTDGAPRDLADARRAGCQDGAGYAALRQSELHAALRALAARGEFRRYEQLDQEAVLVCDRIVEALTRDLARAAAVVTHAYEHGHPDHDTAALAVALACGRLGAPAPARYEFPGYHLRGSQQVFGAFWPDPQARETGLPLSPEQRQAKRAAIRCYASQAPLLALFPDTDERLRPTPAYDFSASAPPGAAGTTRWAGR